MPLPSTQELERVIVDFLTCAQEDGQLGQLTVRIVRQELATRFNLEEEILCNGIYKSFVKETVRATVSRLEGAPGGAELPQTQAPKKDGTSKSASRQRKSKAQARADEERLGDADVSESEEPRSKKASGGSESSKPVKPNKTSKKAESEMKFKSKAIIESSDEEGVSGSGRKQSTGPSKRRKIPAKPSPPKEKQQQNVEKDGSDVEMNAGEGADPSSSSSMRKPGTESFPKPLKAKEPTKDPMESELSSVIDEPPKKRQKKQDKGSTKPQKEETKRGKKETLSKDEETVNKLKGIVVACGVRKAWKKEFEGLDKPSQQIKRLHAILNDFGMTPRYTLEKAKAIRDRRELAQELKDVQEFEKAVKKRGKGHRRSSEPEKSADEGSDVADEPAQKKRNARASIMAFLEDQSEEE